MDRTEVKIEPTIKIEEDSKILSLGSCFADEVGGMLKSDGHDVMSNPAGILFNPQSLALHLWSVATNQIEEKHFGDYQDTHFHFDFHSKTNGSDLQSVRSKISDALSLSREQLKEADYLILTFGTAWVWRYLKTDSIIANCHKVPQNEFRKELLDLTSLIQVYRELVSDLLEFNHNLQIILTVSPVRHTRNGLPEDKRSKSILLLLCHALSDEFETVTYFPAYEVVLDELRDYSYFKGNLIHPTDETIGEVYKRFCRFAQMSDPSSLE